MKEKDFEKVIFIDIENVGQSLENIDKTIMNFDRVLICYAGPEPKVPISSAPYFSELMATGRLQLIKVQSKGKNAADFGITYWAGKLAAQLPKESEFSIFSRDSDFKHLVLLLEQDGVKVSYYPEKSTKQPEDPGQLSQQYCARVLQQSQDRPSSRKSLLNSIN